MRQNIFKIVVVIVFTTLAITTSFAQVTAHATATATIVQPLAIAEATNMNFGIVATGATSGTVLLGTDGSRTPSGGVTLPATTGTVSAASFNITGEGTYTYAITIPTAAYTLTNTVGAGGETMTVDTWSSSPTKAAGGQLTEGAQTLLVGATLNVGASQVSGIYTNAVPFDVTVNYN